MPHELSLAAAGAPLLLMGLCGCSPDSAFREAEHPRSPRTEATDDGSSKRSDAAATARASRSVPSAATPAGAVAPAAPATEGRGGGCQPSGSPERIELGPAGWFSAAVGLAVRFEGTSHDSLEDGRTAMMLRLTLWDTTGSTAWLPDVNTAPRFVPLMGRCVRLVDGTDQRAVIEVAPARKPGAPATAEPAVFKCGPPAQGVPLLEDYATVEDGKRYHVVVERSDHGEWFATPMPRMQRHFGSRIDWTNLIDYPQLANATSGRLRFTFELLSRTIHHYPSQHRWSAAYRARVDEICRSR